LAGFPVGMIPIIDHPIMKKLTILSLGVWIALTLVLVAAAYVWAIQRPVALQAPRVDVRIEPGGVRDVVRQINQAGVALHEEAFVLMARLSGYDTQLKAGAYEFVAGDTPWTILARVANGDMRQTRITLLEGWTYQRIRQALRDDANVRQTLDDVSDAQLMERVGSAYRTPEGLFHPDTYVFTPGATDIDILRRAYRTQQQLLQTAWDARDADLPLQTPYEALILASIVEKETGHDADRARVAGVFINRLRLGMPLQTDPTVIYGMGDAYQGRIRRRDLATDTPWNTYTRAGLPPTPIASPGRAALMAALHPETHDFLYFVARGDGTSEFSKTLAEHNRAVRRFILGRQS